MKHKQMHLGKQETLDMSDQPTLGMKAASPSAPVSRGARKRKRGRSWRFWVIIGVCIILVLVPSVVYGFSLYQTYSAQYQQDRALAQAGVQHLQAAEQLLKTVPTSFDQPTILQARQHFSAALADFNQVKSNLEQIPGIATAVPKYGGLLSAALRIVPLAVEVCQAGIIGTDALNLVAPHLHGILSTKAQGLTTQDIATLTHDVNQIRALLATATTQINQLQPADLQLDPRIGPVITAFRANLPTIQTTLQSVQQVLAVAPALLGIGTPASYLIEQLDSTELRPGGGFIGSYGLATFSGGNLASLRMTDTYLLDKPYEYAGHVIPYPQDYRWFPLAPSWSLRDSNLDADFPTAARYAEQLYHTEGGTAALQGVIAITPAFVQGALNITGPIYVSQYKETITAQNLINRIHYHQLSEELAGGDNPSPDGLSSLRKHFTAVLFEDFFAKVRQIAPTALPKFQTLLVNSLHTKDVQMYLNNASAEQLLQNYDIASKMLAPAGDTLMVVDANIIANKANYFMTYTMRDQVTIDAQGTATHHTTLTYNWPLNPASLENDYGIITTTYVDYLRVYAPQGSVLKAQSGWTPRGTSQKFGLEQWAGLFSLQYGHSGTISLTWTVRGAATHDAHGWHYNDLIQRQAGIVWKLNLHVALPACAQHVTSSAASLEKTGTLSQPVSTNVPIAVNYTC
ncbi:MAG TPA: DUF4012 domain-containing protein [Ktedonobacterales bacterium]|nr:DUF4012 domain-containing protein [Ktedonobacterales bacterium]